MIVCDVCRKVDRELPTPDTVRVSLAVNCTTSTISVFHLCDVCRNKLEDAIRRAVQEVVNPLTFLER